MGREGLGLTLHCRRRHCRLPQAGANGAAPAAPIELSELTAVGPLDG